MGEAGLENNKKRRSIAVLSALLLLLPAMALGLNFLLAVDTLDITDRVVLLEETERARLYRVELPASEKDELWNLMFEATGCVVTVTSGDEALFSYGADRADSGRMIGRAYVSAFLPSRAFDQPLEIRLEASDANAHMRLDRLELCPHSQSTRYYLVNETPGLFLAMILLANAVCIPVFLMLGNNRAFLKGGLYFDAILLCFAVLLLGDGGHYLVFSDNQFGWIPFEYFAGYLLPPFFLLYFREHEQGVRQRRLLALGIGVNLAFFAAAAALGLSGAVRFCDMTCAHCALLALVCALAVYGLIRNLRVRQMSGVKVMLLPVLILWMLETIASGLLPAPGAGSIRFFHFDLLNICAMLIFYLLCYYFAESAYRTHRRAEETSRRIDDLERGEQETLPYETIASVLSESYESVYYIDADTFDYQCYFQSDSYSELKLGRVGDNFFERLAENVAKTIHPDDQAYVLSMLSRENMIEEAGRHYFFVYRLMVAGRLEYRQIDVTRELHDGKRHVILGVRNIDAMMRREKAVAQEQESMLQKERNHMRAILNGAEAYLEVNLTKELIMETSYDYRAAAKALSIPVPEFEKPLRYSEFMSWWGENMIVSGGERFRAISGVDYLKWWFEKGNKRASVLFSCRAMNGQIAVCREVFYLYRDNPTGDILSFCVVYDLTEQQKQEKEFRELEFELQMSRIKNFTSQMQPHFLYNVLGSIQEVVLEDPEYASELIGDFTTHLRGCIRAMANDNPIPFTQELSNIRAYVNIEKMRFGEKLKVVYEIATSDFTIMPLSVQPLVENAIQHGVYERGTLGGTVTVRSHETQAAWVVEVEDDGVGFDVDALKAGIADGSRDSTGLKNLIFRLDKAMGARVDIRSEIGVGTKVTITIPKGGSKV